MTKQTFKQYYRESKVDNSTVVFTFGRFSPPTIGHGKLIEKAASLSNGNHYRIFASRTQDPKRNPLKYEDKIKFMRKMFPRHGRNIILDSTVNNALDALVNLYEQGYTKVIMVAGSDRVKEFDKLLNKYNGVESRHGVYNFQEGIKVVSAGDRDPDSDNLVEGMSASKMRDSAKSNDFATFSEGLTEDLTNIDKKKLFELLRSGMGIKESERPDVEFEEISERRKQYVNDEIFKVGDEVYSEALGYRLTIKERKCNYVIAENSSGIEYKCWIDNIEPIEESEKSAAELAKAQIKSQLESIAKEKKKDYKMILKAYNQSIKSGYSSKQAMKKIRG